MKLTNMLLSSQTLGRGTIRHFSDGDFALRSGSGEDRPYIDSLRLRRPVVRGVSGGANRFQSANPRPAAGGKRGFWSFLR